MKSLYVLDSTTVYFPESVDNIKWKTERDPHAEHLRKLLSVIAGILYGII